MFLLGLRNLIRNPMRSALTVAGLAVALAALGLLTSFSESYERSIHTELDRMGMQMMLVPLGCPYDAAARVIKGHSLDNSLPETALDQARKDPAVAVAAPLLIVAAPRPDEGRTDLWVGIDSSDLKLRPWWHAHECRVWFQSENGVILGCDAAGVEMRDAGDHLFSPETGVSLSVDGVLDRSGTSDDSLFFVPLRTAQRMFHQPGRLTAIAIRLKDPEQMLAASDRLQKIPGAQVVTMTEMLGTFLNLIGSARALLTGVLLVGVIASILGVFNMLMSVVIEQIPEYCVMRALGASPAQVCGLILLQAFLVSLGGLILATAMTAVGSRFFEQLMSSVVPMVPAGGALSFSGHALALCAEVAVLAAVMGGMGPALYAGRVDPVEGIRQS